MRVPVTEQSNPLNMYGSVKPSETALAMAGATMAQLDQTKQKKNAIASTSGTPGPRPSGRKRSGLSAS